MRFISTAALAALVLFSGCNPDRPQPVTAPGTGADITPPPDAPPPRLLLFASEDARAGVEAILSSREMGTAIERAAGYVPDPYRAFAVAGTERGQDVQVTFLPLLSHSDPDELMMVVHARTGDTAVVHAAVVRRSPPLTPARFERHGSLWVSPVDDGLEPGVARWNDQQVSDFWTCVIDRSATTLVSCAIGGGGVHFHRRRVGALCDYVRIGWRAHHRRGMCNAGSDQLVAGTIRPQRGNTLKLKWWILFPALGILASALAELAVPERVPDWILSVVLAAAFAGWIIREMARG